MTGEKPVMTGGTNWGHCSNSRTSAMGVSVSGACSFPGPKVVADDWEGDMTGEKPLMTGVTSSDRSRPVAGGFCW